MKRTLLDATHSLVLCSIVLASACAKTEESPVADSVMPAQESASAPATTIVSVAELKIEDTTVGTGTVAEAGKSVTVHYTGWLTDGTKFDSSKDRGQPFTFALGAGQVIRGWDQGVAGMKVGGVRKLTIPPNLGYGPTGAGGVIPPNATLVFEVELLEVN